MSKFKFIAEIVLVQAISTTAMAEGASSTSCLHRRMADMEEGGPPTKVRPTIQFIFTIFFTAATVVFLQSDQSFVLYSTTLHLPPLRIHCVGGCWGSIPGQLRMRLRHWLSDGLSTRLNLNHSSYRSCKYRNFLFYLLKVQITSTRITKFLYNFN